VNQIILGKLVVRILIIKHAIQVTMIQLLIHVIIIR